MPTRSPDLTTVSLVIPRELLARADAQAAEMDLTRSALIRRSLKKFLQSLSEQTERQAIA